MVSIRSGQIYRIELLDLYVNEKVNLIEVNPPSLLGGGGRADRVYLPKKKWSIYHPEITLQSRFV